MSRIGKQPVQIPDKVKIDIKDTTVSVEGPKGKVSKTFASVVKIEKKDNTICVSPLDETRFSRAMYGTARSVIAGMVKGVSVGYLKELEIQGVGFKAILKAKLKIEGADKQLVGQVTAEIRAYYPPEPYKGKGVRIVGEYAERVRRKEGKTVA